MKKMKEVSALSGLSARTLQYYDERGLLTVERSAENYRLYGEKDLQRLWKILLCREMGFPLDEIRALLDEDEPRVQQRLKQRRSAISREIEELSRIGRFVEKVGTYGFPAADLCDTGEEDLTFAEKAARLAERI